MTTRPSILLSGDDSKPRQTIGRHTVSFADEFNPRVSDTMDDTVPSILKGSPNGIGDSTMNRRSHSSEPSVLLEDDESPRVSRRSTGSWGPMSGQSGRPINPPSVWHPAGTVYRFLILSTVAFILTTGYFSDETIGATNTELRTYQMYRREGTVSPMKESAVHFAGVY